MHGFLECWEIPGNQPAKAFYKYQSRGRSLRTSTRGRGNTTGLHNAVKQGGNTTGNQTGGNNKKIRNVTLMVGKQEKIAFEKY